MTHPRDRLITIYGRKPVLSALKDPAVPVERLLLDRRARGPIVLRIVKAAQKRGLAIDKVDAQQVNRISRNARQDQGVVADIRAPRMGALAERLTHATGPVATALLLDGVTTPANVGLILRSATAAGVDGVVLPRKGCPEVGPLVIKASAGVALQAPIWRCATAVEGAEALKAAGFTLLGLAADGAIDLFADHLPARAAFVLGNESEGVSPAVQALLDGAVGIPMMASVESLNVATAATVVAFERLRRGRL